MQGQGEVRRLPNVEGRVNAGPNHNRNTSVISPEHVAAVRAILRLTGQEKAAKLLGVSTGTLDKVLTNGRLTSVAADKLAMRLDAMAALR